VAAVTAVTEETLVNGYLLTRLGQLGWRPQWALLLSLALRTSYHLYYGLGLVLTIPFGYYATRSFQKRGRLGRPIVAHFLYDATLITLGVLTAGHR
jgi:membrane protease YdiL (CAAX protease family)